MTENYNDKDTIRPTVGERPPDEWMDRHPVLAGSIIAAAITGGMFLAAVL